MILQIGSSVQNVRTHLAEEKEKNLDDNQKHFRVKRAGGAITAAIIGAALTSSLNTGSALLVSATQDKEPIGKKGGCKWFGNGPWCGIPSCPAQDGYEVADVRTKGGSIFKKWKVNGRDYGSGCDTGHKKLCCRLRNDDKRWAGIWERVWDNSKITCTVKKSGSLSTTKTCGYSNSCGLALQCTNAQNKEWTFIIGPAKHCDMLVMTDGDIFSLTGSKQNGLLNTDNSDDRYTKNTNYLFTNSWIPFRRTFYEFVKKDQDHDSSHYQYRQPYYLVGKASTGKITFTTKGRTVVDDFWIPSDKWDWTSSTLNKDDSMTWYKV